MNRSPETRQQINAILRRVVTQVIPVSWKSSQNMPGAGGRKSFYRGQGDDYDGTVEYVPGDDTREIDWSAFASSGGLDLLVNVYKQDTDLKAFVLVDVSPTIDFGTTRATKRELAAEIAASCVRSLDETRDRVGLVIYSADKVERYVPTRAAARMMFPTLTSILETHSPGGETGDGLAKALKALPTTRALVFIVSDFNHVSQTSWNALKRAGGRHDILCFFIQDIRERELPDLDEGLKGPLAWLVRKLGFFYTLEDASGARKQINVSGGAAKKYADNFRKHEQSVQTRLKGSRCRYLAVSTEEGEQAYPKLLRALAGKR
jgi:uncharacterized protein (DUF58 family)